MDRRYSNILAIKKLVNEFKEVLSSFENEEIYQIQYMMDVVSDVAWLSCKINTFEKKFFEITKNNYGVDLKNMVDGNLKHDYKLMVMDNSHACSVIFTKKEKMDEILNKICELIDHLIHSENYYWIEKYREKAVIYEYKRSKHQHRGETAF